MKNDAFEYSSVMTLVAILATRHQQRGDDFTQVFQIVVSQNESQ